MITVGQLMDALKNEIFSDTSINDFEKKCREREKSLKQYLDIVGVMVHQHIEEPGADNVKSYWKSEKIKTCLKNLADYTVELVTELNKEKIENYCKQLSLWKNPFEPDIKLLMLNSYYGTIVTDIYWITEITLDEALRISAGKLDLSELGKRTPNKIKEIQELLSKNRKRLTSYKNHFGTIEEAFNCYKNKYYKAFNLLLLTSIEGLTRTLGAYLIQKQKLNEDPFSYNSLDSFLRKIPWKSNLKTSKTHMLFLTSQYKKINYNDPIDRNTKSNGTSRD